MADEQDNVDNEHGSTLSNCIVCSRLSVNDNRVLTEYIAKLCEKTTTPHVIQEIKSFMSNLIDRQNGDPKNNLQSENIAPTNQAIELHLRSCILPREKCVQKIIVIHDISVSLAVATNENTKIILMELLVQTLGLDSKKCS